MANEERLGSHAKKRKRQGNESDETTKRPPEPRSHRRQKRAIARVLQSKSRKTEPSRDDNTGQEDLSVVLPHGSPSTESDTVGRRDAHIREDVEREPPVKKQKSTDEGAGKSGTNSPAVLLTPPTAAAPSANATERTRFSRFGARIFGMEQATALRTVTPTPPPVIISAPRRFLQQMMNMLPGISQTIGWVAVQSTKGMIWVFDRVGPVLKFAAAGGIFFAVDLAKSFDGSEAHEAIIRLMGRLFDLFYDDGEEDEDEEEDTTPAPSEPKRIEGTAASPQPAKCTCGEASSPSKSAERCAMHSSTFTGPQQQEQNEQTPTILPTANISRREPVPTPMNQPAHSSGAQVLYAYHSDPNAWDPSGVIMGLNHGPLPPPPPPPPQTTQLGQLHFVDFNGYRFVFEWETPGSRDLTNFLAQAEQEFRNSSASSFDQQKCIDVFNGKIRDLIYAGENLAGHPRVAVLPLLGGLVEQSGGTA
ncbi:hypothetical protein KC352_g5937 [Hortaea werneckii]|uniref:Uncharacterized protein n=1 Tax=Hortaea werneckii EXF-2000 TaxID=1157616 RepID=A0A1Z5T2F8_HORWE|nr:hypothetical protein KC350_g7147 [Hortaea werneckii]KAI6838835.1 hypothetical protein KC342_g3818 [Hortaea werneckii]KAI6932674.1 hypothetical protein KC348_g6921 [Hortaea werneckii]KAI7283138.1 hypothetical protein KC352_g5937 [Hortaea werneckii]OTA29217.1 hypothetical protein BTJ68_13123 [Hortaea werneckii EXF-2000]